ncbi:hypothetical protein Tco_1073046 [Tanacetum coccineum]
MAISVISIFSDSSYESVGSSPSRIILFDTIRAEIPAKTPTIPSVVPTLPYTSPFLYIDSSHSDTYERPPSQDPYEVIVARWRSRVAARSSPLSSPTHDSSPADASRSLLVDLIVPSLTRESFPPSDHFSPDDFASDTSSGSSSGYSSDTSSGRSIPDSSFGTPVASIEGASHKRCRSPVVSVPLATPVPGVLSLSSYKTYIEPDIDSDVQRDIDADTAAVEAAAAREADIGVEVSIGFEIEDEANSSHRGTIEIGVDTVVEPVVSEDTPVPTDDEGSREVVQIGLYEIVQELYDHVLEVYVSKIVEIERE